jgi:hypothetical protein
MKSLIPFAGAIVIAAAALSQIDLDRSEAPWSGWSDVATATADLAPDAAPGTPSRPAPYSAAAIRLDPPPVALVCREDEAQVASVAGGTAIDFLEEFLLVSDPREACRSGDLAARGGYDPESGRCYTLRNVGAGGPDLPMVCAERFGQGEGGLLVSGMDCKGWNRTIATADGGDFRFTIAAPGAEPSRMSTGTCAPL